MDGPPTSLKKQQIALARKLRDDGKTWVEVAEEFQVRFRVNPRTALRLARGWSQARAAEMWNLRWPDQPKTLKNFSYWEIWPGQGGYSPSQENFLRLAEIYECSVADLISDLPSFRHRDSAATLAVARGTAGTVGGEIIVPSGAETLLLDLLSRSPGTEAGGPSQAGPPAKFRRPEEVDFGELAQVIVMWTQKIGHHQTRRDMLGKLTAALAVAAVGPPGEFPAFGAAGEGIPTTYRDTGRFDPATVAHCEAMMPHLRRQGDVLGAYSTLPGALAYRRLAEQQARLAPSTERERVIALYAEMTQLAGWLCFNMGDYASAGRLYDDARSAAHEARAVELVTYILCTMSHLATWQGRPRVGIDHAVAAAAWAEQTGSPYARAYAADVAVRAFTADNQRSQSKGALERELAALHEAKRTDEPPKLWWYFYDESFYWSTSAQHALKFEDPAKVLDAAEQAINLSDQANLHNRSFRLLWRAEAFARQHNIGLACQTITDVVELTAVNSSSRIEQRIRLLRGGLDPWKRTKAVRELDQAISSYRSLSASGRTNTAYSE